MAASEMSAIMVTNGSADIMTSNDTATGRVRSEMQIQNLPESVIKAMKVLAADSGISIVGMETTHRTERAERELMEQNKSWTEKIREMEERSSSKFHAQRRDIKKRVIRKQTICSFAVRRNSSFLQ